MSNDKLQDLLSMSEEDIMVLYAKTHLGQNDYGAKEFKNATVAFLNRQKKPLDTWRRELKLGGKVVKMYIFEGWSFDSTTLEQDFDKCLNRTIKYGNGQGATTRIIGYDKESRRVLTQTGTIYWLGDGMSH
jgi:hypothetical protein